MLARLVLASHPALERGRGRLQEEEWEGDNQDVINLPTTVAWVGFSGRVVFDAIRDNPLG